MKKDKILLFGDYSGNNAGHNALLFALIHELSDLGMEIVIPTLNPKKLKRNADIRGDFVKLIGVGPQHFGIKFLSFRVIKELFESRVVLLTDNLFYDSGLFNLYKNNLLALNFIKLLAAKKGIPLVYYNSGVGPLSTSIGRKLAGRIRDSLELVTLRDEEACESGLWAGYKKHISIKADSGFNFPMRELLSEDSVTIQNRFNLDYCKNWVGINLSYHFAIVKTKYDLIKRLSDVLKYIQSEMDCGIIILVTHPNDMNFNKSLLSSIGDNKAIKVVDSEKFNVSEIAAFAQQCKVVIGTRYHELVWFSSIGTPIVGINCGDKMGSLFRTLKISEQLIDVDDFLGDSSFMVLKNILTVAADGALHFRGKIIELKKMAESSSFLVEKICLRY